MPKNDFSESAKYYGLMCSNPKEIERRSNFVTDTLKKHKIKSVLDLGCGNGLYLSPLKKSKFDVEGLDISKEMIKEARKKNKSIKLYLQDMSKFNIHKKYDAIICLDSSLVLLPNFQMIEKTIKKCNEHLNQGGILLLDLPNHKKEIKEAIESLFKVKVENVNTMISPKGKKKAYVKLSYDTPAIDVATQLGML